MLRLPEWLLRLILIGFGIFLAGSCAFVGFLIWQNYRVERLINLDMGIVQFRVGNGDLFYAQADLIAPPENPEAVLSEHRLAWDDNGFRVSIPPNGAYEIIALGDSYTEATNVARPWATVLAEETGLDVLNLAYRGYGPQEEALVMQEYGAIHEPEIVVIGFFGGNDLSNAVTFYENNSQFQLPSLSQQAINWSIGQFLNNRPIEEYQYPVYMNLNGQRQAIAFLNGYVTWVNVTYEALRDSLNLAETVKSWELIRNSAPADACIILAYFPSKPTIYLPYVLPDYHGTLINSQKQIILLETGAKLEEAVWTPNYEELLSRRHNLRDALHDAALESGLHFVDISAPLEQTASAGQMLYYVYDTHWNQAGHDLAAQTLANYINEGNCEEN